MGTRTRGPAFARTLALTFAFAFACTSAASAATLREDAGRIVVSGHITPQDAAKVLGLIGRDPGLDTLLFKDCAGGTLGAARAFATVIADRKLKTLAAGQCSSACALAFLSAPQRRFDDNAGVNLISLHAPRLADGSGPSSEQVNQQVLRWLDRVTQGRISGHLLNLIANSWTAASGVVFMRYREGPLKVDRTVYCDGTQQGTLEKCTPLPGADAVSQGIVTE